MARKAFIMGHRRELVLTNSEEVVSIKKAEKEYSLKIRFKYGGTVDVKYETEKHMLQEMEFAINWVNGVYG